MLDESVAQTLMEFLESYKETHGDYRVSMRSINSLYDKIENFYLYRDMPKFDEQDRNVLYWAFRDHPWPISLEKWSFKYYENTKEASEEC